MITRKGVYGSVTVSWTSGYPLDLIPEFVHPGNITPGFGEHFLVTVYSELQNFHV